MSGRPVGQRTAWRLGAWLLVCTLAACSEGYSTQQGALALSHGMSQERVLAALNKLGHEQPSDFHWHYRLLPGCVLEVHARRFWGGRAAQQVAIRGAEIRESRAADTGHYTVSLVSRSHPTMEIMVLERMDEVDASQVVWLLNDLPRLCAADPETRP
ncbi:MAG: hypothetical protein ACK4NM_11500 [Hydrogenophaga sp.]